MTKSEAARLKAWKIRTKLTRNFLSRSFRRLLDIMTVAALAFAIIAIYNQAQNAKEQSDHLRVAVCGVAENYLAADPGAAQAPKGVAFTKSFSQLRSPEGADCTPDPNDGK